MRCRCCNSIKTTKSLGDWYCANCLKSIKKTIKEDRAFYNTDKEEWLNKYTLKEWEEEIKDE